MRFCCILVCLICVGCYNAKRDCSNFKTGTFSFQYTIDGVVETGKFKRSEKYNIDYFDNKIDSASVRWINDCEFVLKKINPESKIEEKAVHMKILSTTDTSYTFEYNFVGEAFKQKGNATKTN